MKINGSVVCAALAAAVLAFASAAQAQPVSLELRTPFNAVHTSTKAMEVFKDEVARRTGGAVDIELKTSKDVVSVKEILEELRTQNIFGTWILSSHMARLVPEMGALGLPYLFDSYDQIRRALKGPVGVAIDKRLTAKGFISLGWMVYGTQNVANSKRPLRTLNDFKGLKIRVLPDETHMATFRAVGANPVGLDFKDLEYALQQGDIDGYENSYAVIQGYNLYKYGKYLSDTGHVLDMIVFVVNKKTFMSLKPEQQKALRDAAAVALPPQWKAVDAEEQASLAKLKAVGMQLDPLPPDTRAALRRATAGVAEQARKRMGDEIIDGMLAASRSEMRTH